ncbi:MAG: DNA polymerase III subunit delta, partial [Gammaproteobacteria bacterium]
MKIKPEQLNNHLQHPPLKPIYWVSGDEHLIRDECSDQIRQASREIGFTERQAFSVDTHFNWDPVFNTLRTPSLFAEKKRLELNLTQTTLSKKITDGITTLLSEIAQSPNMHHDLITLIISSKLENRQTQSRWYQHLSSCGVHVPIWPITRAALPHWIQQRANTTGLALANDVPSLLADLVEGNLLAAKQEIEKLALIFPNETITSQHLEQSTSDLAQYSTFDAFDAVLAGNVADALRRLHRLRDSGAEPVLLLWGLARDIRCIQSGQASLARGINLTTWLHQQRLLPQRQKLVQNAIKRLQHFPLNDALELCFLTDCAIKGRANLDPWFGLTLLCT